MVSNGLIWARTATSVSNPANVYGLSINVIETIAGDPDWVGSFYRVKEDESRSALVLISSVNLFGRAANIKPE